MNVHFREILIFPIRFELQNFYSGGEIFEFDVKYIIREQSSSMTGGGGGGRNINFSANYFVPHEEKILYFHAPVNMFDFFMLQFLSKKSLL